MKPARPSAPGRPAFGRRWVCCLVVLLVLVASPAARAEGDEGVELTLFMRSYEDLASGLAPIEQGPMTLTVTSPEHRLVVHRVRVWLDPLDGVDSVNESAGRLVRIDTMVEFEGEGELDIHLVAPGMSQRFADSVEAERQIVETHATVRVETHPEGYIFTMAEPGPPVPLAIESALVQQIVGLCQTLAALPMMSLDCSALDSALSVVRVPQPGPGERFLLPYEYLREAERAYFDARLASTAGD